MSATADLDMEFLTSQWAERGWVVVGREADFVLLDWPRSFTGATTSEKRDDLSDMGVISLSVALQRKHSTWTAEITTCGVLKGCARHLSEGFTLPMLDTGLVPAVRLFETHAATVDLSDLSVCVLFGACADRPDHSAPEPTAMLPAPAAVR